jgi:hypothetical protein
LIAAALAGFDSVWAGCDIQQGTFFLAAGILFCYVAICVLVAPPTANTVGDPES